MSPRSLLLFLCLFATALCTRGRAQTSPLDPVCTFNYQAVLRDADDRVIPDKAVRVQLSILDGPGGNELYVEQHDATTTSLGIVVLEVGGGTRIDGSLVFEAIPWAIRKHFLRVEVDPDGGDNFIDLGVAPILAVPIAIQAKVAAFAVQTLDTITVYDSLIVNTLCVDTLKAELAFIDTLITSVGVIETILNDKFFGKDICIDDADGIAQSVLYTNPITGEITLDVHKVRGEDICLVDVFGGAESVLYDDLINGTVVDVDLLKGCVYFDTLKADNGFIDFNNAVGDIIGSIGITSDGNSAVDMQEIYSDTVTTRTISTGEITVDNIVGCTFFDTLKTNSGFISFENAQGFQVGAIGVSTDGAGAMDMQRIYSDSINAQVICTSEIKADDVIAKEGGAFILRGEENTAIAEISVDEDGFSRVTSDRIFTRQVISSQVITPDLRADALCLNGDLNIKNQAGETVLSYRPNTSDSYAFQLQGNLMVNGGIAAEFKQFLIDHPLDPENKRLRHFSIESDRLTNIYNGTVSLADDGTAEVKLPDWFQALNTDFSYQLTCIGGFANVYVSQEIADNTFRIAGGQPGMKISWQVSGVRHDAQASPLPVVEEK